MRTALRSIYRRVRALIEASVRKRPFRELYVTHTRLRFLLNALYRGTELNRKGGGCVYNFRRNIHRIEKGLLYQPPKEVFAEDYIGETIRDYIQGRKSGAIDPETLSWGEAVLTQYFSVCYHSEAVAEACRAFGDANPSCHHPERVPYPEHARAPLSVSYSALYELACRRRSIRFFQDRAVDPSLISQAVQLSLLSPNACNRQSYRYILVNNTRLANTILGCTYGFSGHTAPAVIVVIGRYRGYFDERDILVPVIDAGLAAMSLLYALETLGLGSSCVNWPNIPEHETAIRRHLCLEPDEIVVILLAVGYPAPDGMIAFSQRQAVDDVLTVLDDKEIGPCQQ